MSWKATLLNASRYCVKEPLTGLITSQSKIEMNEVASLVVGVIRKVLR